MILVTLSLCIIFSALRAQQQYLLTIAMPTTNACYNRWGQSLSSDSLQIQIQDNADMAKIRENKYRTVGGDKVIQVTVCKAEETCQPILQNSAKASPQ